MWPELMKRPDLEPTRHEIGRAKALIKLTGGPERASHPNGITLLGKGGKFAPDGQMLPFPGNTFLCHIDQTSEFYSALSIIQDKLREHPYADYFTFLPKPSFHMTIFCGVSGTPLGSDGWPRGFPLDASLNQITSTFNNRLAQKTFRTGFSVLPEELFVPTSVSMRGATEQDELTLRKIRTQLEELTGLYRGDVDCYGFHVSMAYVARWLNEKAAEDILQECTSLFDQHLIGCSPIYFDRVEFCSFNNMHKFDIIRSF